MEDLINRLNEISRLEEELKRNRDFESLIEICNESMKLLDTIDNHIERILQKAYCFARLGRKTEAEKTRKRGTTNSTCRALQNANMCIG